MKTTRRRGATDAAGKPTHRLNVRIDAAAQTRLAIHCAMTGLPPGQVITRLIEGLRDWSMPVNLAERATNGNRRSVPDRASESAPETALEVAA